MGQTVTQDIRHQSYWLDDLGQAPETGGALPQKVDVLVIGAGYTGLSAAIQTAGAGRTTLVLDAGAPGFGCSTRNGGQVSTSIKPSLGKLSAKFGEKKARAIRQTGVDALAWLGDFVDSHRIDCDFRRCGRFHAAHTPGHYDMLTRDAEKMHREEGIESIVIPRAEQHAEMGTDTYFGGIVYPRHCSVQPAKLHRGFLDLAMGAGAQVMGHNAVTGIGRSGQGFEVTTQKGKVQARDVIVATNGYTGGIVPWVQRRVIPIGSYIIVTEDLPQETIDRLFPTDRIASDTCKVVYYYRATPDRRRILFGGRVSSRETDTDASAPLLYENMCRIFPELRGCAISHSWSGTVGYTFDEMAHTGVHDGIHYALGYCGSGVSMAGYLGMRVGQKVLGLAEGRTAFDDVPAPTRPFYTGRPWFLPAAVSYYRWLDARQCRAAAAAA
ncbi:MAG: FAD-dependent oxidoreductase [Rhodobacteraceae bacterium]|nr:FAD-dependent oxidoreductase [Paracoccaceae bacterium]